MAGAKTYLQLFLISFIALFLELTWIRYLGSEIRLFAYFHNLLLVVCFLGLGYGCARASRPIRFHWTYLLSLLLVLLLLPDIMDWPVTIRKISWYLSSDPGYFTWGSAVHREGLVRVAQFAVGVVMLLGVIGSLIAIMAPLGQKLGRLLTEAPNALGAYSADIVGSLLGVWAFVAVSSRSLGPTAWFLVALGLLLVFLPRRPLLLALAIGCTLLVVLMADQARIGEEQVVWSPYQRLSYVPRYYDDARGTPVRTGFVVKTNHMPYMQVGDYSQAFVARYPEFFHEPALRRYDNYSLPYRFHPEPRDVLIVGAGAGNDVAGALRNGVARIDAVEIDPEIIRFGLDHHPEEPYGKRFSERVTVYNDDARSFFKKTDHRYDVIVYGTLDSHTLSSSLCNVRLDSFVYTQESFREAAELLKPDGVLVVLFAVNDPFIGVRLRNTLEEALGSAPYSLRQYSKIVPWVEYFVTGNRGTIESRLAADPVLKDLYRRHGKGWEGEIEALTDDWPYLFLKRRSVPIFYVVVFGLLVALAAGLLRGELRGGKLLDPGGLVFFFLGAGFMLLEVHGITRCALLFGATWLNSAIVISGILLAILLANLTVVLLRPRRLGPWFGALAALLIVNYLFPTDLLNGFDLPLRLISAAVLVCSPVFAAGILFGVRFKSAELRERAFAANLLGAVVGGMAESLGFVVGLGSLSLVALIFYVLAWRNYRRVSG